MYERTNLRIATETRPTRNTRQHPGFAQQPPTAHPPVARVAGAQGSDAHPLDRDGKCPWDLPQILLSPLVIRVNRRAYPLDDTKVLAALTHAHPCSALHSLRTILDVIKI
jgi:hypothetical protein